MNVGKQKERCIFHELFILENLEDNLLVQFLSGKIAATKHWQVQTLVVNGRTVLNFTRKKKQQQKQYYKVAYYHLYFKIS